MHLVDRTRLRRFGGTNDSRFLTFSCENREPLLASPSRKDHFVRTLRSSLESTAIELHAWVVMDNHAHLLLTPRGAPLAPWLATLKRRFVQSLSDWRGRRFWLRGGGFDRTIWTVDEFEEKFRYIHLNPVRAGITGDPVRYRWSSAYDWFVRPRTSAPKLAERPAELSAIFG